MCNTASGVRLYSPCVRVCSRVAGLRAHAAAAVFVNFFAEAFGDLFLLLAFAAAAYEGCRLGWHLFPEHHFFLYGAENQQHKQHQPVLVL